MATGLQVWSQTPGSNANADSGFTWAEGMSPSLVDDSARGLMAAMAKWRDDNNGTIVTSGSSTAYTAFTSQVSTALTAGYTIAIQFNATNDSSATLSVDGLAAVPLQLVAGTNLSGQEFQAGSIAQFTYSSSGTGQWIASNYNKQAVSGFISTTVQDQNFTGGATVTAYSIGTPASLSTVTVDPGLSPLQYLTNGAAFTLGAPANDGACTILVTNGATAGTISYSGFSIPTNSGDAYATTNGNKYLFSIIRINGQSTFYIKALQ